MIVLNEPLQPLTTESDPSHPTGYFRDGYCWGSPQDPGKHYIGAVVTDQFLQYSKEKGAFIYPLCVQQNYVQGSQRRLLITGNDLMTPRPGFAGLKEGCKWCLCVERWKEAMVASERLGAGVVPK